MKKTVLTIVLASMLITTNAGAEGSTKRGHLLATTMDTLENPAIDPFCKAILEGDIQTVKRLISLGEDVNKKSLGMTPAMYAARYNKDEILELLIQNGANLGIKSDEGFIAKKYAELSHANKALAIIDSIAKG